MTSQLTQLSRLFSFCNARVSCLFAWACTLQKFCVLVMWHVWKSMRTSCNGAFPTTWCCFCSCRQKKKKRKKKKEMSTLPFIAGLDSSGWIVVFFFFFFFYAPALEIHVPLDLSFLSLSLPFSLSLFLFFIRLRLLRFKRVCTRAHHRRPKQLVFFSPFLVSLINSSLDPSFFFFLVIWVLVVPFFFSPLFSQSGAF